MQWHTVQSSLQTNDSLELRIKKIECNQFSRNHKQISLLSWFYLVNQKHAAQPVLSQSETNYSFELVLYSYSKK